MLDTVKCSNEDQLILNHVSLLLEDYEQKQDETEQLLCSVLSLILGAFSTHLDTESTLYTQIKLLQFRLSTPITYHELNALQHYVENCADQITQSDRATPESIEQSLKPVLRVFGLDSDSNKHQGESSTQKHYQEDMNMEDSIDRERSEASLAIRDFGESLQKLFTGGYISSGLEQNEKFITLLEVELAAIKHMDDSQEFESRKTQIQSKLEKILQSHKQMAAYFFTDF
ncbi:MAG: hypothetical protein R3240_04860 [Gammaproteobacteria bacterium]|nr:hypothetical protein [Gammaproteobacteria bacterium]